MKRIHCVAGIVAAALAACVTIAGASDLGVVDMEQLVKAHPKSDVNREILRDQLKELESERDAMLATLEKKKSAFLAARKDAADPAVSATIRAERETAVEDQLKELQSLEQEMSQRLMKRQREMNEQKLRMHQRVEDAVRELVASVAADQKLLLVVDKSAVGVGGSNVVVFHSEKLDITDLVMAEIKKIKEK